MANGTLLDQPTTALDDYSWFIFLTYLSGIIAGLFFLVILDNKPLQTHPMKLFMYISLVECLEAMTYATLPQICNLDMYNVFAYTVFWGNNLEQQLKSAIILSEFGMSLFQACTVMEIAFLNCLCLDLNLMLRSPFSKKESRMKWYVFGSIFYATLMVLTPFIELIAPYEVAAGTFFLLATFLVFSWLILSLQSSFYACKELSRPGMNADTRKLIMKRHVLTILLYVPS